MWDLIKVPFAVVFGGAVYSFFRLFKGGQSKGGVGNHTQADVRGVSTSPP